MAGSGQFALKQIHSELINIQHLQGNKSDIWIYYLQTDWWPGRCVGQSFPSVCYFFADCWWNKLIKNVLLCPLTTLFNLSFAKCKFDNRLDNWEKIDQERFRKIIHMRLCLFLCPSVWLKHLLVGDKTKNLRMSDKLTNFLLRLCYVGRQHWWLSDCCC